MYKHLIAVCLIVAGLSGCAGHRPGGLREGRQHGVVRFGVTVANVIETTQRSRLWVIVDVPYRNLQFERIPAAFHSHFEYTLALRNRDGRAVQLHDGRRELQVDNYATTQPESLFVRVGTFLDAPPGDYTLEITLTDGVSRGQGSFRAPVTVRDLLAPGLTLSDILLLNRAPGGFPHETDVIPTFRQRFQQTTYAFVQARHVSVGEHLRATLSIMRDSERSEMSRASLDTVASAETVNLFFPIPAGQLGLGRQELKVQVTSSSSTAEVGRPLLVRWAQRNASGRALDDYVAPMRLIMNSRDWKQLREAPPAKQRELLADFWSKRNPSADSTTNLLEEEFYWRVGEANARFAWGKSSGWESDRGRIYVIHGPPDEIQRRFDQSYGRSLELWRYEDPAREFIFYDEHGDGRFILIRQSVSS